MPDLTPECDQPATKKAGLAGVLLAHCRNVTPNAASFARLPVLLTPFIITADIESGIDQRYSH